MLVASKANQHFAQSHKHSLFRASYKSRLRKLYLESLGQQNCILELGDHLEERRVI